MSCSNITVSAPNQINITVSPSETNVNASVSAINVNSSNQNTIVNGSFSNDSTLVSVNNGAKGDKGDRGIDGISGSQGPSGLSAGVNYINNLSGQLLLTGTGIIYISSANNNTLIVSGDVSSLYSKNNPSGFITGLNTGNFVSKNETGQFYPLSNPSNFSNSGDISSLSGYTNNTFSQVKITGSNSLLAPNFTGVGQVVVSSIGNTVYISGISGVGGGGGGNTNVLITGSSTLSTANFTGAGSVSIVQNGNIVLVSGISNTGAGEVNTASNLGNAIGVFNSKSAFDLRFNSISGGTGIQASLSGNVIFIDSNINTGQFYPLSNPSNFSNSGDLYNTGNLLQNQINNLSGNLSVTGSVLYNFLNGISGNLTSTGQTLYNYFSSISGNLGLSGQQLYSYYSSLSGALSQSGANLQTQINALSGAVSLTGASLLASIAAVSGNLGLTGQNLQNQINNFGGYLLNTVNITGNQTIQGRKLFSGNFILYDGYPSGNFYSGISGLVFQTGVSGIFKLYDTGNTISIDIYNRILSGDWNVNNLIQLQQTGSVLDGRINTLTTNLTNTGVSLLNSIGLISGNLILTGQKTWTDSDNNSRNLSGVLYQSGSILDNKINSLSGFSAPNLRPTITGINVTGSNSYTGLVSFTGNNIIISLITGGHQGITGNYIQFSGDTSVLATQSQITTLTNNLSNTGVSLLNSINLLSGQIINTGSVLDSKINSLSGYALFFSDRSQIPTGVDSYFISFVPSFSAVPKVFISLEITGDTIYGYNSRNIATTGYYVEFTDTIRQSGLYVHTLAKV